MIKLKNLLKEQSTSLANKLLPDQNGRIRFDLAEVDLIKAFKPNGLADASIPVILGQKPGNRGGFENAIDYRFLPNSKGRIAYCSHLADSLTILATAYELPTGDVNSIKSLVDDPQGERNLFRFKEAIQKSTISNNYVENNAWLVTYFNSGTLKQLIDDTTKVKERAVALCSDEKFQTSFMTPIVRVFQGIALPADKQELVPRVVDTIIAMNATGFYSKQIKRRLSLDDPELIKNA